MYLSWDQKQVEDFSSQNIAALYNKGYVFTRIDKGVMDQTRSVRIDLKQFELSSENRRILKKVAELKMEVVTLPMNNYHWKIGKLGKDFYETKFGEGVFSANKIKEILTSDESNFNTLLKYKLDEAIVGYSICYKQDDLMHYSYPFYALDTNLKSLGMGMMLFAIEHAKNSGNKYIYLGSAQRPGDTYKLQFKGLEWYDGGQWRSNTDELKKLLTK